MNYNFKIKTKDICNWSKNLLLPLIVALFFLISSCAIDAYFQKDLIPSESERLEKIPLKVGLYLKQPQFYDLTSHVTHSNRVFAHLQDALGRSAEEMAKQIFQEVITFSKRNQASQDIKFIITPEIIYFKIYVANFISPVWTFRNKIIMKWTITDIKENVLYVNTFEGEGNSSQTTYDIEKRVNECVSAAINELYNKARKDIYSNISRRGDVFGK